jgi:5-formyltetrahydrofolate cyclo-ligase
MIQPAPSTPIPPPDKAALRRRVLAARAAIADADRVAAGVAIAESAADLAARLAPRRVSVFFSIRGEIETAPLLARLAADGVALSLPVIAAKDAPLVFRAWRPGDALETRAFGLREPPDGAEEVEPDLLLVPLAAFDRRGFRLGYGGGFYDRTLAKLRAKGPVTAIGLAFAGQEVPEVPIDAYDQRLDGVLTEAFYLNLSGHEP